MNTPPTIKKPGFTRNPGGFERRYCLSLLVFRRFAPYSFRTIRFYLLGGLVVVVSLVVIDFLCFFAWVFFVVFVVVDSVEVCLAAGFGAAIRKGTANTVKRDEVKKRFIISPLVCGGRGPPLTSLLCALFVVDAIT